MRNRRLMTVIRRRYWFGNTTATNLSAVIRTKDSVDTAMVTSAVKLQVLQRACPIRPWTKKTVEPLIWDTISRGKWNMEYKRSEAATLAINRFIVIFDFREAKISREFPASEAIKSTLYIEAEVLMTATRSIDSQHVPFCSGLRENSELLLTIIVIETGTQSGKKTNWWLTYLWEELTIWLQSSIIYHIS